MLVVKNIKDTMLCELDGQALYQAPLPAVVACWNSEGIEIVSEVTRENGWVLDFASTEDGATCNAAHPVMGLKFQLKLTCYDGDSIDAIVEKDVFAEEGEYKFKSIRLLPGFVSGYEGDGSQLVLPCGTGGICKNEKKTSAEYKLPVSYPYSAPHCSMPLFGALNGNGAAIAAIVDGGQFDFYLSIRTCWGDRKQYSVDPVFELRDFRDERILPEDILVHFKVLEGEDASYAGIGKAYRNYNISERKLPTLNEKMKDNPVLQYSSKAIYIRCRLGHKPVPPTILEQTPETEPEVKVYMTFDDALALVEECAAQGVGNTEFCMVGWNYGGHDGAWPTVFPVEEKFGGEEGYRKLISRARELGYPMSGHDNYWSACTLSNQYDAADMAKDHDGSITLSGRAGGGQYYQFCAKQCCEKYVTPRLEKIRELGVNGVYYSDVISVAQLTKCYDSVHPMTRRENAEWFKKIFKKQREFFGAASSEGARDWALPELDRAYSIAGNVSTALPYIDEDIPLYPIVYHGFLIYNAFRSAVNIDSGDDTYLTAIAYGSMPTFYYHHIFNPDYYTGADGWTNDGDLVFGGKEKLKKDVRVIKQVSEDAGRISALQTEFIDDFKRLNSEVTETTYSNGFRVLVNHSMESYVSDEGIVVAPKGFVVVG
ncbi:DUF5696 domain-containing protein [Coraliomargarita parva]|uniref:DUF5696 domain-containing protein n=1 Tax=Coraliomargarita parva TaxID=3014050 RepID=UPI0022B5DB4C|nr:DUF5696 domain-containing protein [Coraliomargarita parva]